MRVSRMYPCGFPLKNTNCLTTNGRSFCILGNQTEYTYRNEAWKPGLLVLLVIKVQSCYIIISSIPHSSSLTGVIESLFPFWSIRIVSSPGITLISDSVMGVSSVDTYQTSTHCQRALSRVERGS